MDPDKILEKLDKAVAGAVVVSDSIGGITFKTMIEVMEFAKLMATSRKAVPPHLRGDPGACLGIIIQALEWRMSPFAVANKSYEVNDRIAYESQLIHAVIEARAPITERLRPRYEGNIEDGTRKCIIVAQIKGEATPLPPYESPILSRCKKKSPLWTEDPDQQLFYYSSRAWARRYCPDVLLGIYTDDELRDAEIGPANARDITPKPTGLKDRLKGRQGQHGFQPENTAALPAPTDVPIDFTISGTTVKEPEPITFEQDAKQPAAPLEVQEAQPVTDDEGPSDAPITTRHELENEFLPFQIDVLKTAEGDALQDLDKTVRAALAGHDDLIGRWNGDFLSRRRELDGLRPGRRSSKGGR